MKKKNFINFRLITIIVLIVVIGFSMAACGGGGGGGMVLPLGSGQYAGKDVLGNAYSLSVGSDASHAALKGDRYKMNIKTRDGITRSVSGTVTKVSADGTLTLKPDGSTVEFTSIVSNNSLNSVASSGQIAKIPLTGGSKLMPRSFNKIYLRAARWNNPNDPNGPMHGENYGSGLSVLVKDYPTNVSKLTKNTSSRYTFTINGTSDKNLEHVELEVQGLTSSDEWKYLGGYTGNDINITANMPFSKIVSITTANDDSISYRLRDYKEIILQFTNVKKKIFDNHHDWDINNGSIPANIPNGQIMAAISNFKISLKDSTRAASSGNAGDYNFGFAQDGLSADYRQAVWSLSAENIVKAKQAGAKFEFTLKDIALDGSNKPSKKPILAFIWQDPDRGLWWQDQTNITDGGSAPAWTWSATTGTTWNGSTRKMTINLSDIIHDSRFAASTKLNFIIACWYYDGSDDTDIDDINIVNASITTP